MALCVPARAQACSSGQGLLQKKYMVRVCDGGRRADGFGDGADALYRLLEDEPGSALNAGHTAACSPVAGRFGDLRPGVVHMGRLGLLGFASVRFAVVKKWVLMPRLKMLCHQTTMLQCFHERLV